jgi:hypothetical protein
MHLYSQVGGRPWDANNGSANVAWLQFDSIEAAWAAIIAKTNGWFPKP